MDESRTAGGFEDSGGVEDSGRSGGQWEELRRVVYIKKCCFGLIDIN